LRQIAIGSILFNRTQPFASLLGAVLASTLGSVQIGP